jgi:hypothetical protein
MLKLILTVACLVARKADKAVVASGGICFWHESGVRRSILYWCIWQISGFSREVVLTYGIT